MPIPSLKIKKSNSWQSRLIKKSNRKKNNLIGGLFRFIILLIIFGLIFIIFSFISLGYNLPDPNKLLERAVAQSTKIYDRNGRTVLYEIFTDQRRTMVSLSDVPRDLIFATIVIEDKNFYRHPGFDLRGIIRAVVMDVLHLGKVQGGSTITQQFIKNALLTPQKTYARKIRELILAYQIEKNFSKEQILQMYLNEIPYGSSAYGIEAASQIYFGKSARDLTLDESALLAALPKAPTYYSPFGQHRDELVSRKNYILDLMVEEGYITQERAELAKNIDTLKKIVSRRENIIAPHFVMYVKDLLAEKYGVRMVEQGGLKVITTLDLDKQKIAEEEVIAQTEKNWKNFNASNAALVALDVRTGQILSMVGSKDFFDKKIDGQVNVTIRPRQPGSSFKPIVYATAFQKGFTPETILFDVETNFGPAGPQGQNYIPKNYDEKERGPVTMRQALAGSLNIPGVKTLYLAGLNNVLNLAQQMGYTTLTDPSRYGLSLVLGGGEVKLLEHTAAFSIFAREGKKIPTIAILKVEDSKGNVLEEWGQENFSTEEVIPAQIARQINNILSDNEARSFIFGANSPLYLGERPAAAKTGTTNDWRDGWTIGYTPQLACGVWVGNNNNDKMKKGADGVVVAAPIWHNFMIRALANEPIENFTQPETLTVEKPILRGEIPGDLIVKIDKASGKLATDLTPPNYIIEKSYKTYHSILHYVDKDNPQGPPPEEPGRDPQYFAWEEGIKKWMEKNKINLEGPPTEYDDLHTLINKPKIEIVSPLNGATINDRLLKVDIAASAPRGVRKVECLIDNQIADQIYNSPYECYLNLTGLTQGLHKIKAIAYDDIDNNNEDEIEINLTNIFNQTIIWLWPQPGQIIYQESFPLTLSILTPLIQIKTLKFYAYNLNNYQSKLIGTVFNPNQAGRFNFIWPDAESANYELWVELTDLIGQTFISDKITISIR
ncbi:MAG: penicillin-binding protein [Patescibacteria group bacterium]